MVQADPFKDGRAGDATVGGALHGFGDLEADEVAEALAVLEAEVVRSSGEFGEGEGDHLPLANLNDSVPSYTIHGILR